MRFTDPQSPAFRRIASPVVAPPDKSLRRRLRRVGRKLETQSADEAYESTPYGRRRKRLLRPATFVKLAVVAGLGALLWYAF